MSSGRVDFPGYIPGKCPKISVERASGSAGSLAVRGDPFHMGSYRPGDTFVVCDYDLPGGAMSQLIRGFTSGPVYYRGRSCTEIIEYQFDSERNPLMRSRRLVCQGPQYATTCLSHVRREDGSGMVELLDLDIPLTVRTGTKWRVRDLIPDSSSAAEVSEHRVDGLYRVLIGKHRCECFRWLRTRDKIPGPMKEAEEIFISTETGLTVLTRHYIGQGWPNIDDFRTSPKMEIDGFIYYLWFVRRVMRS